MDNVMDTRLVEIYSDAVRDDRIQLVADILRAGRLAVIPTETVYGLAANAYDSDAVAAIFAAKGRPQDNPLIVHIADMDMLGDIVSEVPDSARRLAEAYWPGPLTMIMRRGDKIPASVSAGLDTVAVRMPSNPIARQIIRHCGCPLAAPSANLSGSPSPTTAEYAIADMMGRVDCIVMSDDCEIGVESTVVLLADGQARLLRPGGITLEQLEAVIGPVAVDSAVLSSQLTGRVSSPGMKYKHYAPKTKVIMVDGDCEQYAGYVCRSAQPAAAVCFEEDVPLLGQLPHVVYGRQGDDRSQAHGIFTALRRADQLGAEVIYAHAPSRSGVGLAVYNRLLRAAAFEVVTL